MDIVEFNQEDVAVVEVRGRIDTTTSGEFGERLLGQIEAGARRVLVDLTHVAYISSAGFRALLIVGKQCEEKGRNFGLCGLSREVQRLFEIGTFDELFQIFPTRPEAISKLSSA